MGLKRVVKLSAQWCGPCKSYSPVFEEVTDGWLDDWEVVTMDIDEDPAAKELAATLGIRTIPATIFMVGDEDPAVVMGAQSREQLNAIFDAYDKK